jgi:hypothetical protein
MADEPDRPSADESSGGDSPFGGFEQEPIRARRSKLRINPVFAMVLIAMLIAVPVVTIASRDGGGGADQAPAPQAPAPAPTQNPPEETREYQVCSANADAPHQCDPLLDRARGREARRWFRQCVETTQRPRRCAKGVYARYRGGG